MDIFKIKAYKAFLKKVIEENKGEKSFQGQLSKAANCQRSYLSQVLHREMNINLEQAFGIANFLKLSKDESEYFLLLVQLERTGRAEYKKYLKNKMQALRDQNSSLSNKIEKLSPTVKLQECAQKYYSHWSYMAVHIAAFLPQNKKVSDFSKLLGIKEGQVRRVLKDLEKFNIMINKEGLWTPRGRNVNIKDDDNNIRNHHLNWRMQAIDHLSDYSFINDLHYSGVLALSSADSEKLKTKISEWIVEVRNTALDSLAPEKCINFNVDFFEL